MPPPSLIDRLAAQHERIARATRAAGRPPQSVRLLAVSKTHPASAIRETYAAGQRDFGENYVQELCAKAAELQDLSELRWHLLGHLQTNKAKLAQPLLHVIHTVASIRLVQELSRRVEQSASAATARSGGALEVLVEVNVGAELNKSGCSEADLAALLFAVEAAPGLALRGLMTVPPQTEAPEGARPYFERLAELRESCGGQARLPELSMGMSADCEVAIACGATWVRIGTAIFGGRPSKA